MKRVLFLKLLFSIILLIAALDTQAQSVVPNASFELIVDCPENATPYQLEKLADWKQPGDGTPDIFNTCSRELCHPRGNFAGAQQPREGNGYAGFIAYSNQIKTYREYLQVKLAQPLITGTHYRISMYVSLADHSGYAVSNIGCGFNPEPLKSETNFALTPAVILESDTVVADTTNWTHLVFEYEAKGMENYFLLGNFRKLHEIKKIEAKRPGKRSPNIADAYYYVDDVSITETEPTTQNTADKSITTYLVNDSTLVLSNLEFDYNSYTLSEKDKLLLEKIAGYFTQKSNYCLTVEGHTDANGGFKYNNDLSMKRAEEVSAFLSGKGIEPSRLMSRGFGYTRPIDKNVKSAHNRRVEIKFRKCD